MRPRLTCRAVLALMAAASLASCAETAPQSQTQALATGERRALVEVPVETVIAAFDAICLATAPDFVGATARIARQGFTNPGLNGTMFVPNGGMSAKVSPLPESRGVRRERCSIVFNTNDSAATQADATEALDKALGDRGITPDAPSAEAQVGQRLVRVWPLTIDGRRVRMTLIPSLGPRIPAGLFLDVTAGQGSA